LLNDIVSIPLPVRESLEVNELKDIFAPKKGLNTFVKANGVACETGGGDLVVCTQSQAGTSCAAGQSVTNQNTVVAIVLSTGKNGSQGAAGANETENVDGDAVFVYRTPDPSTASGGEYDDLTAWIPVGLLYGRLIAAGVLP